MSYGPGHTIAVDVVFIEDHVTQVDRDPVADPALLRHVLLADLHLALDRDGALDGVDDACELGEQTVDGGLHDTATRFSES